MESYRLTVRRNVNYIEYADVTVKANSLEEAKKIAQQEAEYGEYEFDHDAPIAEFEVFSEGDE